MISEKELLDRNGVFGIYQINKKKAASEFLFSSLAVMEAHGYKPKKKDYTFIYAGNLSKEKKTDKALDKIYKRFTNAEKLDSDFSGHLLSISDIVAIHKDEVLSAYFVNPVDFVELTSFFE